MCVLGENFSSTTGTYKSISFLGYSLLPFPLANVCTLMGGEGGRLSVLHLDPWSLRLCLKNMKAFKEEKEGFLGGARESLVVMFC